TTLCLATAAPIAVSPAMNHLMWSNAATRTNVATLAGRGVQIYGPGEGDQACGEIGEGRMLEPLDLVGRLQELRPPAQGAVGGCSLPRDLRASASTRCASSAIAARGRWGLPWRRPRARRVPRWCW